MAQAHPKAQALRELPPEELQEQVRKLRQELWQLRVKIGEGAQQQTHPLRLLRRQIARVQTVLRERTRPSSAAQPKA